MKLLLQILAVMFIIFVLYVALAATVGILIRIAIYCAIIAAVVAWLRHLIDERRKRKLYDGKSHRHIEKKAEQKLKEMEREVNGP